MPSPCALQLVWSAQRGAALSRLLDFIMREQELGGRDLLTGGALPAELRSSMRKALGGMMERKGSGRLPGSWAGPLPASSPRCRPPAMGLACPDSVRDIARCSPALPAPGPGCPRPSADIAARRASAAAIAAWPAAMQVPRLRMSLGCVPRGCPTRCSHLQLASLSYGGSPSSCGCSELCMRCLSAIASACLAAS